FSTITGLPANWQANYYQTEVILTYGAAASTIWNGAVSSNWATAGNWSAGVPLASSDVIIPNVTNDPVISAAGAVAKSVTVQSGGMITISASGTLSINGAVDYGLLNQGIVQNNGILNIGNVSEGGQTGLVNEGTF